MEANTVINILIYSAEQRNWNFEMPQIGGFAGRERPLRSFSSFKNKIISFHLLACFFGH